MRLKPFKNLFFLFILAIIFSGCATIRPDLPRDKASLYQEESFSYDHFDAVLARSVDNQGRVSYKLLKENHHDLDAFLYQVAAFSPDSHPELFPTREDKLAYWINAYNAYVIKAVLVNLPIKSVLDVKPPTVLFFLPDTTGFFLFQRFEFGGATTSLYYLENSVIRKRFEEPRIHFAVNCASISCPHLPNRAFEGDILDAQLQVETLKFLSQDRNVRIDHENKTIWLSSIFKWYESDFKDPSNQHQPNGVSPLIAYVLNHSPPEIADELRGVADTYAIEFVPYNWMLNNRD